ncbi:MAG TPA: YbdK family carboxylate-amine ligase [Thermoleophilaceae bacterium]|nr:YbdK family carboxylate-amine ligase [Thermoleophilaceae bacterium]
MSSEPPPTGAALRAAFDAPEPLTVGIEEELMLLDPETLDLVPRARELVDRAAGDPRFKLELPASQLEIVTAPARSVPEALGELAAGRAGLAELASGLARPAAAAVHPFAPAEGELNRDERYIHTIERFGRVARRQLVCALQVHVAVGGADRTLAVHNALRSYLPELAALAANGPFHEGQDTGLASVRPKISEGLPRQGVPPPLRSWDELAEDLSWGLRSGGLPSPRVWWWELRAHPVFGTLELRVPDAQTTLTEAAAVAAFAHSLVGRLVERFDAGERLACDPTWRIAENRWSAASRGVEGTMADLETGEPRPARDRLTELIRDLEPVAARLGCAQELASCASLVERNGAMRQREVAAGEGLLGLARWLADRFLERPPDLPGVEA